MKRLALVILSLALAWAFAQPARCAEPVGVLRVLFLGHDRPHHNSNVYEPLLASALENDGIKFDYFTKTDCLSPDTLQHYDAVMLYANHGRITPEQFDALNSFVQSGHGFLPIHCASACFGHEPRFASLVGGRFKSHKTGVFKPVILTPNHPVFEGVKEYETWDETYVHSDINANNRELLMERRDEGHVEPWTWTRTEGKGRVFYTASGHDERTWKDQQFQRMLRNAIIWSVGDERKVSWEKSRATPKP